MSTRRPSLPPGSALQELAPVGRLGAIVDHIVDLHRPLPRAGRVDDVEPMFVGGEGEPVRPFHVVDHDRQRSGAGWSR